MLTIGLGRAAQFLLMFAMLRAMTELLSPPEVGRASLILGMISLFTLMLPAPVGAYMIRKAHEWHSGGVLLQRVSMAFLYDIIVVGVALAALATVPYFEPARLPLSFEWCLLLIGGALLFGTSNQRFVALLNFLEYRKWFVAFSVLTTLLGLGISAVLVVSISASAEYWVLGQILGQSLIAIPAGAVLISKSRFDPLQGRLFAWPSKRGVMKIFEFAWPLAVAFTLGWLQANSYRFVLEAHFGLAELGLFFAGFGLAASLVGAFDSVVTGYFQPIFYRRISGTCSADLTAAWSEYVSILFPALLLTVIAVIAAAPTLAHFALGANFGSSAQFLVWGAIAEGLRLLGGIYGVFAHGQMNTRSTLLPLTVGALCALILMLIFAPIFGVHGVGAAIAVAGVASVTTFHKTMLSGIKVKFRKRGFWIGGIAGLLMGAVGLLGLLPTSDSDFVTGKLMFLVTTIGLYAGALYLLLGHELKVGQ